MAFKKKQDNDSLGEGTWLNTYSDMVTLILTFFILLFTMSSVDAEKWQVLMKAFNKVGSETSQVVLTPEGDGTEMGTNQGDGSLAAGDSLETTPEAALPDDFDQLYAYIKAYVEENQLQGSVSVEQGDESVFIRFQDNIFFDPDSSRLKNDSRKILDFLGACFGNVEDQILAIRINGHTATVPGTTKTPGYDRTLSTDRANSVLIYLEEDAKIEPKKLVAIGYGRNYPVASNDLEEERRKNRRVEMMILSNDIDLTNTEDIYKLLEGDFSVAKFPDAQNKPEVLIPNGK